MKNNEAVNRSITLYGITLGPHQSIQNQTWYNSSTPRFAKGFHVYPIKHILLWIVFQDSNLTRVRANNYVILASSCLWGCIYIIYQSQEKYEDGAPVILPYKVTWYHMVSHGVTVCTIFLREVLALIRALDVTQE